MPLSTITLRQFEQIDGLMSSILRMGPFETCADPRGYVQLSSRLFDALINAFGYEWANAQSDVLEAAAHIVTQALLGQIEVLDEEAV